ncbi:unnamed protein product [Peronospora belbahrii]|uniref:EF-hand domain-containing protein n=1 Tax=Peronospora belbahrii TaxID=622444 RepID=A0AAU9KKX5_9STRA|nr:unnamed protein product [Peronospora belbahrii]CAH0520640.1 unnamed protein product [Peronospora belbahrii]
MGLDQKYCKLTVHPTNTVVAPSRVRRQTVGDQGFGSCQYNQPVLPYKSYVPDVYDGMNEEEDDTDDIAVLSEDEPLALSRRRAHTTSSMSTSVRLSNILNPLSRMTMRWTEHLADEDSNKTAVSSTTSSSTTPDLFATPPPLLSQPMLDLANSFLDVDTNGTDEIMRPTFEELASMMAGTPPIPAGVTLDMLPNEYETPPIPSHLRNVLMIHNQHDRISLSPVGIENDDVEGESDSDIEDDDASSIGTDEYSNDLTSHSVDIDRIRQTRDEAVASMNGPLRDSTQLKPRSRRTHALHCVGRRNVRGLSSPPRMLPQVALLRKATVPERGETTDIEPYTDEISSMPMYHGQELHLAFKTTTGKTAQVEAHPKRRSGAHRNPFSRRVRCHEVQPYDDLEESDTLRIIGHTTEGLLCGGDCVSFARTDGMVLRMQKMSKKLKFSNKIDVRAKFIITGVPDRTPVSSSSNFYLQSMYDRNKTVGYLPSRRENYPGCLAMYLHRNVEDKIEPVQFFKRPPGHNLVFWHRMQREGN